MYFVAFVIDHKMLPVKLEALSPFILQNIVFKSTYVCMYNIYAWHDWGGGVGLRQRSGMARGHEVFFLARVLLMQVNPGNCGHPNLANSSSGMISAGARQVQESDFMVFEYGHSSDGYCKSMGFRPWTTTVSGNIFLILVFVAIMWFAAKLFVILKSLAMFFCLSGPCFSTLLSALVRLIYTKVSIQIICFYIPMN